MPTRHDALSRRLRVIACRGGCGAAIVAALALLGVTVAREANAAEPLPLVLEATIPLANVSGRIDHMAIDLGRRRLIVAELGNGTVEVIDVAALKIVHRFTGLKEPQGVGFVKSADLIAIASAGDGTVRLFRAGDFSPAGVVALGDDADNIRIDPASGRPIVGYGGGGLAVIDAATAKTVATIPLAGHPESFQLDPKGGRIFVNVPDAHQIAVVDLAAGKQVATWQTPGLAANFPMAIDPTGTVIASVFRNPARLVLFAAGPGTIAASQETCGDSDDVFFDAKRDRIYVSCGAGDVDVFGRSPTLQRIIRMPTESGARTSLFVPELDRLYVAQRAGLLGSAAAILVLRPQP
jgi:hypothetical protein